jgi:hypothetical protein
MAKRKNPHAVALGRTGGKIGGKARWREVSPEERSIILRRAVQARWARRRPPSDPGRSAPARGLLGRAPDGGEER